MEGGAWSEILFHRRLRLASGSRFYAPGSTVWQMRGDLPARKRFGRDDPRQVNRKL
jgi:hypothetical protein